MFNLKRDINLIANFVGRFRKAKKERKWGISIRGIAIGIGIVLRFKKFMDLVCGYRFGRVKQLQEELFSAPSNITTCITFGYFKLFSLFFASFLFFFIGFFIKAMKSKSITWLFFFSSLTILTLAAYF